MRGVPLSLASLVLLSAVVLIGGVHPEVRLGLSMACGVALLWRILLPGAPVRVGAIGLAGFVVVLWTGVQCLPLPMAVIDVLASPTAAAARGAASGLGTAPPTWHPMTLDPGRTAMGWLDLSGMLAMFLVVSNLPRSANRRRILHVIEVGAVLVFLAGVGHAMLDAERILGVYRPSVDMARLPFMGTLVNPNHNAALMLLGACVAFGQWTASRDGWPRRLHQIAWVGLSMGVLLTASRANGALLVAGLSLLALLHARHRVRAGELRSVVVLGAGRVALGMGLLGCLAVILLGSDRWLAELGWNGSVDAPGSLWDTMLSRWDMGITVFLDRPWNGSGFDTFGVASAPHMTHWIDGWLTHPHNALIQALCDWGAPVTIVAVVLAARGLIRAVPPSFAQPEARAAAVGLGALFLQNQVDFSLFIPAVGYGAAAVLGTWIGAVRAPEDPTSHPRVTASWARPAFASTWGLILLLSWPLGTWAVKMDTRRAIERGGVGWDQGAGRVFSYEPVIAAHPADFYLLEVAAHTAQEAGNEPRALGLARRAKEVAPAHPQALLNLGRIALAAGHVDEGIEALRTASRMGSGPVLRANAAILSHTDVPDLLTRYLADSPEAVLVLGRQLRMAGRHEEAASVYRWALDQKMDAIALEEEICVLWSRDPARVTELDRVSISALARGSDGDDSVQASRLMRLGYLAQGYVLRLRGDLDSAWHMFVAAARLDPDRQVRPWLEAAETAVSLEDWSRARKALSALETEESRDRATHARILRLASIEVERGHGDLREAVRLMQRSLIYQEDNHALHDRLADLYGRLTRPQAALHHSDRAAALRKAASRSVP